MLKMKDQTILNALDLKNHFAAWDAMRQLREVADFAKVHCLVLATVLKSSKASVEGNVKFNAAGRYAAKYLDKAFWLGIVEQGGKPAADWKYPCASAEECMAAILNEKFPEESEKWKSEYEDAAVEKKLKRIATSGKLTNVPENVRTTVIMLALCELAEVDVYTQDFQQWDKIPQIPAPSAQQERKPDNKKQPPSQAKQMVDAAEELPDAAVLRLNARKEPYCFYYYESDSLNTADVIRVVRIEAGAGRNKNDSVTIQLIHPKTKQIIRNVAIRAGDYRDCTAVNGRVVKFLPTMAVSRNLCVVRNPDTCCFEVVPHGSKPWTLGMDRKQVKAVTSLAVGDSQDQGFLFVTDGKVISYFYKPAEDYAVRMDLQMIFDTIVEARIEPEGYCLLTSIGTVISDIPEWNGRKRLVSLSDWDRKGNLRIDGLKNVNDVAMSIQEKSLAVRDAAGKLDVIFEDDPSRSFHRMADGTIRINSKGGQK